MNIELTRVVAMGKSPRQKRINRLKNIFLFAIGMAVISAITFVVMMTFIIRPGIGLMTVGLTIFSITSMVIFIAGAKNAWQTAKRIDAAR